MVVILPADELDEEVWLTLISLGAEKPEGWTLVGAQMVALHGFEAGRDRIRVSADADVLVDVRVIPAATREFSSHLQQLGFGLEGVSPEGVGHCFVRGVVKIDVLAPDGLGDRADVMTVPPARTVRVPGGSQALRRSEMIRVQLRDRRGEIPRPNLTGALLVKARAVDVDDSQDAQLRDLAFLLSLVEDPDKLREEMTDAERRWLRKHAELRERGHPAWRTLSLEQADDGQATLLLLTR